MLSNLKDITFDVHIHMERWAVINIIDCFKYLLVFVFFRKVFFLCLILCMLVCLYLFVCIVVYSCKVHWTILIFRI